METRELSGFPVLHKLQPGITLRRIGDLEAVVIDHPLDVAAIALHGAHLLTWTPAGEPAPVIWLSPTTPLRSGIPIRGGVPICWPWFCDLGDDKGDGKPFHGFARILPWTLAGVDAAPDCVAVTLTLSDSAATRPIWDHDFALSCRIEMKAAELALRLTVHGDFATTAALHSYFEVDDIDAVEISGTGPDYADMVRGGNARLPAEPLTIDREFCGIFSRPATVTRLADGSLRREVTVAHGGNSNIVVWNPWIERSKVNADMPDDGYRTMLCIETACVDAPLRATPAKPAVLSAIYRVARPAGEPAISDRGL